MTLDLTLLAVEERLNGLHPLLGTLRQNSGTPVSGKHLYQYEKFGGWSLTLLITQALELGEGRHLQRHHKVTQASQKQRQSSGRKIGKDSVDRTSAIFGSGPGQDKASATTFSASSRWQVSQLNSEKKDSQPWCMADHCMRRKPKQGMCQRFMIILGGNKNLQRVE